MAPPQTEASIANPQEVGSLIEDNNDCSAGSPYLLLFRIEAMGFPTFRLLLDVRLQTRP